MTEANLGEIESLRVELVESHRERFGRDDDLLVGLQLTHSGRFARPNDKARAEPRIAAAEPVARCSSWDRRRIGMLIR